MMRIRMMVSAIPLLQSFVLYMKQLILLTHRSDKNFKKNRRHFYNLNLSSSKCVILQSFSLNDDDDDDGYEYPEVHPVGHIFEWPPEIIGPSYHSLCST
jgi:hypothetical protein